MSEIGIIFVCIAASVVAICMVVVGLISKRHRHPKADADVSSSMRSLMNTELECRKQEMRLQEEYFQSQLRTEQERHEQMKRLYDDTHGK